jgi:hypothetical protein
MIFENTIEQRGGLSEGGDTYQGAGSQGAEGTEDRDEQGPENRSQSEREQGVREFRGGRHRW